MHRELYMRFLDQCGSIACWKQLKVQDMRMVKAGVWLLSFSRLVSALLTPWLPHNLSDCFGIHLHDGTQWVGPFRLYFQKVKTVITTACPCANTSDPLPTCSRL